MNTVSINHTEYQEKVKTLSTDSLKYIIKDCQEALKAFPDGPKAGYYQDEINYCVNELNRRNQAQTDMEIPTKAMVENLKVGDILPNCFGQMKKVTQIFGRGTDLNGKAFVCFYQEFSDNSTMSNSIKEGEKMLFVR